MLKAAIIFLLATVSLRADEAGQEARFKKLPPGDVVSPQHVIEGMALALGRTNPLGYAEKIELTDGRGFDTAMRIVTRRPAAHPWSFQATAKTSAAAKRGDVMLAVFWARAAGASEEVESAFVFEHGGASRERSAHFRISCEREWKRFFVPFRAVRDEPAGEAVMRFHAGFGPQVIEIGGLEVFNYGRRVRLGDLPYTPLNYKGREPGAAWRAEAAARIEKLRKAAMFITVRNAKGKIVPWTHIRVRQVRHAYDFGSAVSAEPLLGKGDDSDMYRDVIMRAFNNVVLENALHWPAWESGRQRALDAVAWLRGAGIGVRGHALLWPGWKHLPAGSESLAAKPAELRKRILDHTRDIVGALKGQVSEWDAVNEAVRNTDIQRALGQGILAEVFKTAHEADANARLFINDRGIFAMGGKDTGHQDAFFKILKGLLDAKAPVHGIGIHAHFDDMLPPPVQVWEILDRFLLADTTAAQIRPRDDGALTPRAARGIVRA